VTIAATGSSGGRTDLIVARILDPQYEGNPPADPTNFQYDFPTVIQGVPSGTLTFKELGLNYPAIALAKVALPASTGTVTSAMITDLRRVAQPRRDRAMVTVFPTGDWSAGTAQQIPAGNYGSWPITSAQRPSVLVPDWATRVDIVAHMPGIVYVKSNDNSQSVAGVRTGFGSTLPSQNGIIVQDGTDAGGRFHYTVVGTHIIDSTMRGTYQYINIQGNQTSGTGRWYADYQSSVVIDWEFSEGAQ
jgi:hypothetical protein